ncbi:MAG TPA: hemolysin family protein [Candidatus Paceibacterota bacterium]|nr:hemolysin family protein [Candidatus Paceibacterota bacterium]
MIVFIVSCATAIIVSFLCSLMEAVLLSLNPLRLQTLQRQGHKHAAIWLGMKRNIHRPVAAILILNTVAHTGGATIAGGAFDEIYGDQWLWVFSAMFTVVILVGTEIIPKLIGVAYSERLAPWIGVPLAMLTTFLRPLVFLSEQLSRLIRKSPPTEAGMSVSDLRTLAGLARTNQAIEAEQESIIINTTRLQTTLLESVMAPRERIAFLQLQKSNIENFELVATTLHTRYPVSETDGVDGITGYVNFKEIVAAVPSRREVRLADFIRPLVRLHANLNLNEALKVLIGRGSHIALVEDAGGRIVGLIALEDVLEEIVGELGSEFDNLTSEVIAVAEGRWKVGGGVTLSVLAQKVGVHLRAEPPGVVLSDWLSRQLQKELVSGDTWQSDGLTFTVLQIRRRRAHRILVEMGCHTADRTAQLQKSLNEDPDRKN